MDNGKYNAIIWLEISFCVFGIRPPAAASQISSEISLESHFWCIPFVYFVFGPLPSSIVVVVVVVSNEQQHNQHCMKWFNRILLIKNSAKVSNLSTFRFRFVVFVPVFTFTCSLHFSLFIVM